MRTTYPQCKAAGRKESLTPEFVGTLDTHNTVQIVFQTAHKRDRLTEQTDRQKTPVYRMYDQSNVILTQSSCVLSDGS